MLARACTAALGGVLGVMIAVAATAAEDDDAKPKRCVSMGAIRSTKIVDDATVLFYQAGGRIWLNRLDRECVGLTSNGKFTYEVQSGARYVRLCSTDTITVLERAGRGFSCGLGEFEPISVEAADSLLGTRGARPLIEAVPVELPKDDEAAEPAPQ